MIIKRATSTSDDDWVFLHRTTFFSPDYLADVWTIKEPVGWTRRSGISGRYSLEYRWIEPNRYHQLYEIPTLVIKHRILCVAFALTIKICLSSLTQLYFFFSGHCTALAALAGSQLRTTQSRTQTNTQQHEMTVPNDLIGCIIGKGGTKIAEIRQISGAMIRISNCEEREGGNTDRTITISGNPDAVALAQYLINMRWVRYFVKCKFLRQPTLVHLLLLT